jgi:hypothetical protein
MKKVFKYPLSLVFEETKISLPAQNKLLKVAMRNDEPFVWFEVSLGSDFSGSRTFRIFGTGHEITPGFEHIETFFDGSFVWHLYEKVGG